MRDPSHGRNRRLHAISLALAGALVAASGCGGDVQTVAQAVAPGPPPARLDDNRSAGYDPALTVLVDGLLPFVCPPIACTEVHIGGRVVGNPKIVTLYWDDDWDAHNPSSPSSATIDSAVDSLARSEFLDFANQYGVNRGSLDSSHGSSSLCVTRRPSGANDVTALYAWLTCEVQTLFTGVPLPDDDTVYAVFLPEGATITGALNADCSNNYAFHAWAIAIVPDPQIYNPLAYKIEGYPFTVVPAECAKNSDPATALDNFTSNFSHELVESTTDPFAPTGWIDNSLSSDVVVWTSQGEAGDICSPIGAVPTPSVRLSNGQLVNTYWSNANDDCVPFASGSSDVTPPDIAAVVSGTAGGGGWYQSDVTVTWNVTDPESTVSSEVGCDPTTIDFDTPGAILTCTATSMGGTSSASVTIMRDATSPVVTFSGNAGTYDVDATVAITCSASDALSGVASSTCADVNGPSWTFGLGPHTVSASATDVAGNTASASTTFTVDVTLDGLCNLARTFSDKARAADELCRILDRAGKAKHCEKVRRELHEFREELWEHVPRAFTVDEAKALSRLSRALAPADCQGDDDHHDHHDHHDGHDDDHGHDGGDDLSIASLGFFL